MDDQDADIVCVQGIETQEHLLPNEPYFPNAFNPYFFDNQEATNGVAIYCRDLPKAIMTGLGFTDFDHEARYIQADFEHISFGSLLAPLASSVIGSIIDTFLFFSIAFYGTGINWITLSMGDLSVKIFVALLMLIPFRLLLGTLRAA